MESLFNTRQSHSARAVHVSSFAQPIPLVVSSSGNTVNSCVRIDTDCPSLRTLTAFFNLCIRLCTANATAHFEMVLIDYFDLIIYEFGYTIFYW